MESPTTLGQAAAQYARNAKAHFQMQDEPGLVELATAIECLGLGIEALFAHLRHQP